MVLAPPTSSNRSVAVPVGTGKQGNIEHVAATTVSRHIMESATQTSSPGSTCKAEPYALHKCSTIPPMREMWLLDEQMNWNRHSTGGWRSMRAP